MPYAGTPPELWIAMPGLAPVVLAVVLLSGVITTQPKPQPTIAPAHPTPVATAAASPAPNPTASPIPVDVWTVARGVETFNRVFDFLARLVTLCLFLIAVGLLVRYRKYID